MDFTNDQNPHIRAASLHVLYTLRPSAQRSQIFRQGKEFKIFYQIFICITGPNQGIIEQEEPCDQDYTSYVDIVVSFHFDSRT